MLSKLSSRLPTINALAPSRCTSRAFVIKSHSPLLTSANHVSFCPGRLEGGDGHDMGQPVLSVAFRLGSTLGYPDDGNTGGDGVRIDGECVRRSSMSTQGTVNEDRGIM
jgi:hypothetical protein